jgi:hypothetical protein
MARERLEIKIDLNNDFVGTPTGSLPGYSNGQAIAIIQSPRQSANYTCYLDFELANTVNPERRNAPFIKTVEVEYPEGSGLIETWYEYGYPIGNDITSIASSNTNLPLKGTVVFIETVSEEEYRSKDIFEFAVVKSTDPVIPAPPPDVVANLQAQIDAKRDRDPSNLAQKSTPASNDVFTLRDEDGNTEKGIKFIDLKNEVNEQVVGKVVYTTGVSSGIDDPVAGFGDFNITVETTQNDDYPNVEIPIPFVTTLVDTYEPAISVIYPAGFFIGTAITNLAFVNSFTLKTTGTSSSVKTDYYKVDDPDDLSGVLLGSNEITFNDSEFTLQSKSGILPGPFDFDPNAGDRMVARVYVKSANIGDTITAEIGGSSPKSFVSWNIPSGDFSASKMNIIINPIEGDLVKQKADGNVEGTGIHVSNILQRIIDEVISGNWTFETLINFLQNVIIGGNLTIGGDLIVQGDSFKTETQLVEMEDPIPEFATGNISDDIDVGIDWEMLTNNVRLIYSGSTDKKFRLGLANLMKLIAFIQDGATSGNITVFNTSTNQLETKTAAEIKTLLAIQISDVEDLQNSLNQKLETFKIYDKGVDKGDFKSINIIRGGTVTPDATDPTQANVDILGLGGVGEGLIESGQVDFDSALAITTTPTVIPFTTTRQSTNTDVFLFYDKNELVEPANILRVRKTKSIELDKPLQYKFTFLGRLTNTNSTNRTVTFTIEKDSVVVKEIEVSVQKASAGDDGTNNFTIVDFLTTDILNSEEDYQLFISSTTTGVTLTNMNAAVEGEFVSGETLPDIMTTPIYDPNKVGKVSNAQSGDATKVHLMSIDAASDLFTNNSGTITANSTLITSIPTIVDSSPARLSFDNKANYYPCYDRDAVTPLTGTEISDKDLEWKFTGAIFVIVRDAKIDEKADKSNVLELDNTTPFTPDADYEPSTKKYVDDGLALKAIKPTNEATATDGQFLRSNGDGTSTFEDVIVASALTANVNITVGSGGNYSNVNDAIEFLSKTYYPVHLASGNVQATITLLTGFIFSEQVFIKNVDLSWITITGTDAEHTIDRSALTTEFVTGYYPAFGGTNCKMPVIDVLFSMDTSGTRAGRAGIYLIDNSHITVTAGAGIKNSPSIGAWITKNSKAYLEDTIFTGCQIGLSVEKSGIAYADGIDCSSATVFAIKGLDAAEIIAVGCNGSDSPYGIRLQGSKANVRNGTFTTTTSQSIYVLSGSICNAIGTNCSSSLDEYYVSGGSIIYRETFTGTGGTNITINTLTANGIIFD